MTTKWIYCTKCWCSTNNNNCNNWSSCCLKTFNRHGVTGCTNMMLWCCLLKSFLHSIRLANFSRVITKLLIKYLIKLSNIFIIQNIYHKIQIHKRILMKIIKIKITKYKDKVNKNKKMRKLKKI